MGNIRVLVTGICSGAANDRACRSKHDGHVDRERVREIGILKALGFRKLQVLGLLLGESVLLALGGSLLGRRAKLLYSNFRIAAFTEGFIQSLRVTPGTLLLCAVIGTLIGLVSGRIPAWRAHAACRWTPCGIRAKQGRIGWKIRCDTNLGSIWVAGPDNDGSPWDRHDCLYCGEHAGSGARLERYR